jgi:hypothetical protein
MEVLLEFDMMKTIERLQNNRINLGFFELVRESNTFLWLEQWDDAESLTYYCNDVTVQVTFFWPDV